jgi:hypothetical protein
MERNGSWRLTFRLGAIPQAMTHAELSEAPQRIAGLVVANMEGLSKQQLALPNLTHEELARIALKFAGVRVTTNPRQNGKLSEAAIIQTAFQNR